MISEGIVRSRWNLRHVLLWCAIDRNTLEGDDDAALAADDDDALATPPLFVGAFVFAIINNWIVRLMMIPMMRSYNYVLDFVLICLYHEYMVVFEDVTDGE